MVKPAFLRWLHKILLLTLYLALNHHHNRNPNPALNPLCFKTVSGKAGYTHAKFFESQLALRYRGRDAGPPAGFASAPRDPMGSLGRGFHPRRHPPKADPLRTSLTPDRR